MLGGEKKKSKAEKEEIKRGELGGAGEWLLASFTMSVFFSLSAPQSLDSGHSFHASFPLGR